MSIIDRYITTGFLRVFLVCFLSFSGLFVVVDAFTNLEEFLALGRKGNLLGVICGYYGPRLLQFFDKMAPMIVLVAAIFTIALMQRSNELTAISAGGISKRRIAKPILYTTLVIIVLSVANRELLMPCFRPQLVMQPQDMAGGKARSVNNMVDTDTGIQIYGKEVMPVNQTIESPRFSLQGSLASEVDQISAISGEYRFSSENHPNGYLLQNVDGDPETMASQTLDGNTVIYTPREFAWLGPDEIFIASEIDTLQLAFPKEMARNANIVEMMKNSRKTSASSANQLKVDIHWRIVQPVFDLSILLIGLPLVFSRGETNLFVAAGYCLVVVMAMVLVAIASQALGVQRILSPPSLAAWLPVITFLPFGVVAWRMLDR